MSGPHPTPAEGTSLGTLCPHTGFRSRRFCNRSNPEHNSELTLCRGEMAADRQPAGNPHSPQLLSVQLFYMLSPIPLPREGSLEIKLCIVSAGKHGNRCSALSGAGAGSSSPGTTAGSNRIPELHKCPQPRGKGSAAEGLSHRLGAKPGVTQRSRLRFPLQVGCFRC